MRGAASKAAAALAIIAIVASAWPAAAAQLPPQVTALAAVTSFYMLTGDVRSASKYSTLLCQLLATLPPGAVRGNPDEAYRLAYLASIRLYAPGYVDYQLMQLVYAHLTGPEALQPSYCGSAAPPASAPPSPEVARLIEEAEKGTSYEETYSNATRLVYSGIRVVEPNYTAAAPSPPPPPVERVATSINLTQSLRELLERFPGLNVTQAARGVSIGEIAGSLRGIGAGAKGVSLPGIEALGGGAPQPPALTPPSLPPLTLPSFALPPLSPWLAAGVAAVVAAALLVYKAGDLARLFALARRRASLRRRIVEAAERGDVDAVVEAFAELLELIGEECRPRLPSETHREYGRVLRGEALREYLRAALLYEAARFGGRLGGAEAARAIREAAERLLEKLECREEGG